MGMKRKKLLNKARKLRSKSRAGEIERNIYIRVDRSDDPSDPVVDYTRSGSSADDVAWDNDTSIEDHAINAMSADGAVDPTHENIGAAGLFAYTPGSRTEYVGGDDFERVAGDVYKVYGSYHEVIKPSTEPTDSDSDSSGSSKTNKITGTKVLTPLDYGYGSYYEVKYGGSYYYKGDLSIIYENNLKYECKISGAISASLSVKFELSVGLSLSDIKAKFSALGYSAQVDGSGNFKSSKSLNVSKKMQMLGKEKIVFALSDSISQTTWETGIWKTLLALAQATNAAYVALNVASSLQEKDYEDKPEKLGPYLEGLQIVAIIQGSLGLIFAAAALVHDKWFNDQVDDIKSQVGNPIYGKPFVQMLPDDDGTIELNTGQGASLVLKGKTIYLNADGIELLTGSSSRAVRDGVVISSSNGPVGISADHADGAHFGSTQGATILTGTSLDFTAYNSGQITSHASKWTHDNEFAAGTTTVGDLTASSLSANGVPVVPTAPVVMTSITDISITEISLYVNVTNTASLVGLISAL